MQKFTLMEAILSLEKHTQYAYIPPTSSAMPSLHFLSPLPVIFSLFFLAAVSLKPPPPPCTFRILPLLPCVPFVQAVAPNPSEHCCHGLRKLYSSQPPCLCLLLNNTSHLSSFPINATLALRLPSLCNFQVEDGSCSGKPVSPTSPPSQILVETNTSTSSFADSPAAEMAPRATDLGLSFGSSNGVQGKAIHDFKVLIFMAFLCYNALISVLG